MAESRYRHRRPRFYDDDGGSDGSGVDDYPPPKPRSSAREDRRSHPPPPYPRNSHADNVPPPPPPPLAQTTRRPSILASDDDADDDDPRYSRRRGAGPPKSTRHDAEQKTSDDHQRFRAKRDGYESDEGQMHRQASKSQTRQQRRDYEDADDYGRGYERGGGGPQNEQSLPMRGKPRDRESANNNVAYVGAAGAGAAAGADRFSRRRTDRESEARDRQGYDDYDPAPARRQDRRRTNDYDDPGYRSDAGRRPQRQPRPVRDYDDYDDLDRAPPRRREDDRGYRSGGERQSRPRPQDYYSDYREDRAPRRGDPRQSGGRAGGRNRDDRYYDDRVTYDRDRRQGKSAGNAGMKDWQKEAGAAFMTYAMPVIRKEGTKYFMEYMAKKQSGRR